MPATLARVLDAADQEWQFWGRSTWNLITREKRIAHRDDEQPFAEHVIASYCAVAGGSPTADDIQDDRYAWSAVGLSAILKQAGYEKHEFPFAQSHSVYIRRFITDRRNGNAAAAFWGFRFGEPGGEPDVGDLVGYARGTGMTQAKAMTFFDKRDAYASHTDVVVAKRPGEIDVIGANVLDSVTRKTLKIDADGHIADTAHPWFVTLKRRGA